MTFRPRSGWIPQPAETTNPFMRRFWEAAAGSATAGRLDLRNQALRASEDIAANDCASGRLELAESLEKLGYFRAALRVRMHGIDQDFDSPDYWWLTIDALNEAGEFELASDVASRAFARFPLNFEFMLAHYLMLPVMYDSLAEIESIRRRFTENLNRLIADGVMTRPENVSHALAGLAKWGNFLLPYQGYNDRPLQEAYGSLVARVVREAASNVLSPLAVRTRKRVRVGFVSEYLGIHVVAKTFQGWIKYLDRDEFETRLYHFIKDSGPVTAKLAVQADEYFRSDSLDVMIQRIRDDELDILVYLDVGMTPPITVMAALRLAPVQCTTWGHPVTTGLPTIDYFISGESIEPEESESHYSETLVKLPGPGVAYDPPDAVMPLMDMPRSAFGLRATSTVFLCTQSTFKYLPQFDWVLAEIASQVPDSQFVFVIPNRELGKRFLSRVDREFSARGRSIYDDAVVLPRMDYFLYRNVYALGDVFLDTIGFSSFNTAIDAVSCGVPIVTCRGSLMRGCLAASVAEGVGLDELIAADLDGFVRTAVRLARDRPFRQGMIDQMSARRAEFFADRRSIAALEDFFRQAVGRAAV